MSVLFYLRKPKLWLQTFFSPSPGSRRILYVLLILLLVTPFCGNAQNQQSRTVNGRVTDSRGEPVQGVTVTSGKNAQGTSTDADGRFTLHVTGSGSTLSFTHIGYISQTVALTSSTINVTLEDANKGLDEVVVVGYSTQNKAKVTGAVATISPKVLESRPVTNVSQALQGVSPGLNITQSGSLGGSLDNRPTINIRGVATIGQGSTGSPLILVDGMEADINAINPQDIESISVLKDAASSSIYGSRAPFGVILITTKKGRVDKVTVNYNNNFSWSKPVWVPEFADSYKFALFFNDANRNIGSGDFLNASIVQRILDYQEGTLKTVNIPDPNNPLLWATANTFGNANNNMYDAFYGKNAFAHEHNLSASGGSGKTTYYLSADYRDENGLLKITSDTYKRLGATAKISTALSKWASVEYSGRFIREEFEKPSNLTPNSRPGFAEFTMNQYFTGWMSWPIVPVYDDNGKIYSVTKDSQANLLVNGGRARTQNDWMYHQLRMIISPLPGWNIFGNLNYRVNDLFTHIDNQKLYGYNVAGDPMLIDGYTSVQEVASRINYFSPNLYSEYGRSFGEHNVKVLAGFQSEESKTRNLSALRQGIIVPTLPTLATTSGTDANGTAIPPDVSGQYGDWSTSGYFGRINYDYKGRYLVEGNIRYDGTSRFRSDKRWKYFPSVSAGWNIARESFWEGISRYVNTFKIRGSYGELGNQNTTNLYPTYVVMPVGTAKGTWLVNGSRPNTAIAPSLVSSMLTWERVRTWNLGVDAAFFDNKLTASFDYFTRYTNDMVGPAMELPVILGTPVPPSNNTDLKTYGIELDLNWQHQLKNGLNYFIHLVLSDAQTTILKYPNATGNLATYIEGRKTGEIWGAVTKGIAKTQGEMDEHLASLPNGGQNAIGNSWKAGDVMYTDINEDGKIDGGANTLSNHGDLQVIGNSTPRYSYGFDIGFNFKGFDFRAFFQGIMKRDYFRGGATFFGASGQVWWSTAYEPHMDYFRDDPNHPLGENLDAYYPRPLFNTVKNQIAQTRFLQDASYLRLKNLQLGYTIPLSITRKIMANKLRIYVSGENLWTKTKMSKVYDPETIDGGYNGAIYPLFTRYSLGASITF
ncbi:MAG: TonB-dependent receptor [Chitinophagaceae bacterium]|nr:TonB-dependent receptor [Chitinophagaceae bacterium]